MNSSIAHHNNCARRFARELERRGKYDSIDTFVDYTWKSGEIAGEIDVLAVKGAGVYYFEIKTGQHLHAWDKARKQARTFYTRFYQDDATHFKPYFIYVNTRDKIIARIKPWQVLS